MFYLPKFLVAAKMVQSISEARRKIQEGALKINGERWSSFTIKSDEINEGDILQIGKKAAKCGKLI